MPAWNFTSNVLNSLAGDRRGLVALTHDGSRHEWTFGEVAHVSSRFAGALRDYGVSPHSTGVMEVVQGKRVDVAI